MDHTWELAAAQESAWSLERVQCGTIAELVRLERVRAVQPLAAVRVLELRLEAAVVLARQVEAEGQPAALAVAMVPVVPVE